MIRSGASHAGQEGSPGRRVALLVLLALAGCSHGSANLDGHWRGIRSEGVKGDALEAANAYAAHMRFDVKGDVLTLTTAKETRTDHYTVVSEDKTKTVIATDQDGPSDPQTFTFSDAKTMKWSVGPSGSSVVFTKE